MPRGPAHQSAGSALFLRSTLNHPIDTLASFSPHLAQPGFGFLRLVRQSRVTSTRDDKVLAQPCLAPRCTLHAARPESGSDWNWRTRNSQVQYEEPLLLGLIFDSNRRGLFPTLFPLLATPYPSSHLTLAYRHSPCLISMSRPLPQPPPPFLQQQLLLLRIFYRVQASIFISRLESSTSLQHGPNVAAFPTRDSHLPRPFRV